MTQARTIYEFFAEHECTEYEKKRLIVYLAEIRYEATLKMLKRVLR